MFQVKDTLNEMIWTVYGVRDNPKTEDIEFLICENDCWRWMTAYKFTQLDVNKSIWKK